MMGSSYSLLQSNSLKIILGKVQSLLSHPKDYRIIPEIVPVFAPRPLLSAILS
jgi:hypothetical protein